MPADCLLISGDGFETDETNMFGGDGDEKPLVPKCGYVDQSTTCDPFLLSDTHVVSGSGIALVCAVGAIT